MVKKIKHKVLKMKKNRGKGVQCCPGVHGSNGVGTTPLGSVGSPLCLLLLSG